MLLVKYPEPSFRMKNEAGKEFIFDTLRRKWLSLTPEEWVRQNFIQYLVQVGNYPATLIALEKEIWLGELKKRFDVLVYNKNHEPWMIVECKAGSIRLNDATLQQALRYNLSVPVEYLLITNGEMTFGWHKRDGRLHVIDELPLWGG
ncbi:MAG: type I restriction enzyme HsdR N-terminal domain-containing protein [Chitinophagaceae bacterium]|nr:type I restriction enzyme HsdR N-terminal domain-containing protein [Chitinophagaceae bacterium]